MTNTDWADEEVKLYRSKKLGENLATRITVMAFPDGDKDEDGMVVRLLNSWIMLTKADFHKRYKERSTSLQN